jgi:hypothetical protein
VAGRTLHADNRIEAKVRPIVPVDCHFKVPSGDMIVDEIGHSVVVDQPVAGGEVDPGLPFLRRDIAADRSEVGRIVHGHFLWRSA